MQVSSSVLVKLKKNVITKKINNKLKNYKKFRVQGAHKVRNSFVENGIIFYFMLFLHIITYYILFIAKLRIKTLT